MADTLSFGLVLASHDHDFLCLGPFLCPCGHLGHDLDHGVQVHARNCLWSFDNHDHGGPPCLFLFLFLCDHLGRVHVDHVPVVHIHIHARTYPWGFDAHDHDHHAVVLPSHDVR